MKIIEVNNLTKRFKNLVAVDHINFQVQKGEIYGFVGLNGAGKTTTIRMLLNMINTSNGNVKLFDKVINNDFDLWNQVGYIVEKVGAYPNLSVRENLKVFYNLRQLKNIKVIDSVIEELKLNDYENIKAKNLSQGNLQRLGIAKTLIHQPKLLILDEPLNGLDPLGRIEIREKLVKLSKKGVTIFISSHILGELGKFATKIGIIHQGKLIKELDSKDLKNQLVYKLIIDGDQEEIISYLKNYGNDFSINENGKIEIVDQQLIKSRAQLNKALIKENIDINELSLYKEDLEDFFTRTLREVN